MYAPRKVVIDDTDHRIRYLGPGWLLDEDNHADWGNFGPTYNSTSYKTSNNGSLSFDFNGTSIALLGTTPHQIKGGDDDTTPQAPSWDCFLDNIKITSRSCKHRRNYCILCEGTSSNKGLHTFTVNVTTAGQTFWVDSLQIAPSSSFNDAVILVPATDTEIKFSPSWAWQGNESRTVVEPGANATFNFLGKSVTWVGSVLKDRPWSPATGSFSVDGGTPTPFNLNGRPPGNATLHNQAFFATPELELGHHSLVVTYCGNEQTMPLTLDYLLVSNSSTSLNSTYPHPEPDTASQPITSATFSLPADTVTMPVPNTTSTTLAGTSEVSPTSPSGTGTSALNQNSSTPIGAIVGGVIGGLFLILLVLFLLLWHRQRQRRNIPGYDQGFADNRRPPSVATHSSIHARPSAPEPDDDTPNSSPNMSSLYLPLHSDRYSMSDNHASYVPITTDRVSESHMTSIYSGNTGVGPKINVVGT